MSTATLPVLFRPPWKHPPLADLDELSIPRKLQKVAEDHYAGLKTLSIHAEFSQDAKKYKKPVQAFRFETPETPAGEEPDLPLDALLRLAVWRVEEHGQQLKKEPKIHPVVTYRFSFYGYNANEDKFEKMTSIKVNLNSLEDTDEEQQEDDTPNEGPPQHPYYEGWAELPRGDNVRLLRTSPLQHPRHQMQMEAQLVAMMRILTEQQSGVYAELRASQEAQRVNMLAFQHQMMSDVSTLINAQAAVLQHMSGYVEGAQKDSARMSRRIIDMSEQQGQQMYFQQKANEAGWNAFLNGMQMREQAQANNFAVQDQMRVMQLEQHKQALEQEYKGKDDKSDKPSAFREFMQFATPLGMAGLLAYLGNEEGALAMAGAAMAAMGGEDAAGGGGGQGSMVQQLAQDEDDEEEEEEEEEDDDVPMPKPPVFGRQAQPRPKPPAAPEEPVMGVPAGGNARQHFDAAPLVAMLQLFRSEVTPQQEGKLKQMLPMHAWFALQRALKAETDDRARAALSMFAGIVRAKNLEGHLLGALTARQKELYEDIKNHMLEERESEDDEQEEEEVEEVEEAEEEPDEEDDAEESDVLEAELVEDPNEGADAQSVPLEPPAADANKKTLLAFANDKLDLGLPQRTRVKDIRKAINKALKKRKTG